MNRREFGTIAAAVERDGLLGLYRIGLFDPTTCWPAPALMAYWNNQGLAPLMDCRRGESGAVG